MKKVYVSILVGVACLAFAGAGFASGIFYQRVQGAKMVLGAQIEPRGFGGQAQENDTNDAGRFFPTGGPGAQAPSADTRAIITALRDATDEQIKNVKSALGITSADSSSSLGTSSNSTSNANNATGSSL